jgi:hypothetical protein
VALYFLKEIKEIFFTEGGDTFGQKLKHFFFPWTKKPKGKVVEPKNVKYNEDERKEAVDRLLIHNFFISCDELKRQIKIMEFGHPRKNEILRGIILIYVETIEKYAINIIQNFKLDELDVHHLNAILVQEIEKASYEIYNRMKDKICNESLYNKIIEDPIKGFKVRNSIFKEVFVRGVLNMSTQAMSVYHYDNYERASEILTSMYISLQVIVKNFEKVFKDYNGELDQYLK